MFQVQPALNSAIQTPCTTAMLVYLNELPAEPYGSYFQHVNQHHGDSGQQQHNDGASACPIHRSAFEPNDPNENPYNGTGAVETLAGNSSKRWPTEATHLLA